LAGFMTENMLAVGLSTDAQATLITLTADLAKSRDLLNSVTDEKSAKALAHHQNFLDKNMADFMAQLQDDAKDEDLVREEAKRNLFAIEVPNYEEWLRSVNADNIDSYIAASSAGFTSILEMDPSTDKLNRLRDAARIRDIPLPDEIEWKIVVGTDGVARGSFQNRAGHTEAIRTEAADKYLNKLKPWFELQQDMDTAVSSELAIREALDRTKREADAEAARKAKQWSEGEIDGAEESLSRQRAAEAELAKMQTALLPIDMMMKLLSNPAALMMARYTGTLGQIEEQLKNAGLKDFPGFTFGKGANLPANGALPSNQQWQVMTQFEKMVAKESWKAKNAGSDEDFRRVFLGSLPGRVGFSGARFSRV
jgi:hypothetical protein